MGTKEKILVAMSGGVDSSVAALLLQEQGFDVVGASMHLVSCHRPTERSCCSAADRLDAQKVCETLGIPHVSLDYREQFRRDVILPFIADYTHGRTPIPCVRCNAELKFKALFDDMQRMGADRVATGHYARVEQLADGSFRLLRGSDRAKDQSYYLYQLTQRELRRLALPIGTLAKDEVRRIARERGFVTADKPDSQEICFVTNDDYVSYIEEQGAHDIRGEGNFVDVQGKVLGRHRGIHAYTVGQRRGLGISFGHRMYVTEIRLPTNEVVLGSDDDLLKAEMMVGSMSWVHDEHGERFRDVPVTVQIRASHRGATATFCPVTLDRISVTFAESQRAIAPGQVAAVYHGDELIGGGWIQ